MRLGFLKNIVVIFVVFSLFVFIQCTSNRKIIKQPIKEEGADFVFNRLKKNELRYEILNIKFNANVILNKKNFSFSGNLRIKRDSVIWLSLSPALGIEAFRLMLTPDSVKLLNRINNTYIASNFQFIYDFFKTTVEFDMLPAFLAGNDFPYYENNKFKVSIDNQKYLLSTIGRRKLRKIAKNDENMKIFLQNIWLSPETFKITKMAINEIDNNKKLEVNYGDFIVTNNQLFPSLLKFEITGKDHVIINIKYNKVVIDEKVEFPFNVPDKYVKINK
jgi:hypothetical protein